MEIHLRHLIVMRMISKKIIKDIIIDNGNKMPLSNLGNMLRNRSSDFDVRNMVLKIYQV